MVFSFDRHFQTHKNLRTKKEDCNDSNFVIKPIFETLLFEQQQNNIDSATMPTLTGSQ